ncbi:F0F1 ATP synthase subunit delta [Campylobacter hyointestinalis]|uniref:F0F1 ATP synthase subunit delta n=1 Tax=Campylobacter hyointestinalis TaxID=198 RepID=UPI000CE4F97A|nr:F0F1 ATP synthase subunit delta [Campylobacter hyointestinalis]PPB66663.1 F0F1 ATP synthase subunit delta [Campylobacter hyointestinalis subsp. hyointestinalis]
MKEVIAKKYVRALIASLEASEFDKMNESLAVLGVVSGFPRLKVILDSPDISSKSKSDFIFSLVENGSEKLKKFINLLGENKRLDVLPDIAKEFAYQKSVKDNEFTGLISGNFEFSKAEKEQLEQSFSKKFGSKISFETIKNDYNGVKIELDSLGLEVSFSIDRLKAQMSEYILKAI